MSEPQSLSEKSVLDFLSDEPYTDLPAEVIAQGKRCLLDLLAVAAGGSVTSQALITREHVVAEEANPEGARILFDGRRVSVPGAAWANAAMIESLDAHDGHSLTKGHAGVALLPAILAVSERRPGGLDDAELLVSLVKGYEVAIRCGLALHGTAPEYHSSGAWNSVAVALVSSYLLGGTRDEMLHAAGIAEYFGPRGPMMRCIAMPSMVKDSSAWGSRVGVEMDRIACICPAQPAVWVSSPVNCVGLRSRCSVASRCRLSRPCENPKPEPGRERLHQPNRPPAARRRRAPLQVRHLDARGGHVGLVGEPFADVGARRYWRALVVVPTVVGHGMPSWRWGGHAVSGLNYLSSSVSGKSRARLSGA
jgi:hypothetical protein